jgi:acyl-CoA thioesterase I
MNNIKLESNTVFGKTRCFTPKQTTSLARFNLAQLGSRLFKARALRLKTILSFVLIALVCFETLAAKPPTATTVSPNAPVLVFGDSLSAEYGLKRGTGWVALMQSRLAAQGVRRNVINASISGETSSGGKTRLPELLAKHKPALVMLELGANDALRGLAISATQSNLKAMVQLAQQAGAKVLIIGTQIPPNYGKTYTEQFAKMFTQIAQTENTSLVPFMLEGFADKNDYFQADRLHPLEKAHPIILETIWKVAQPLFK